MHLAVHPGDDWGKLMKLIRFGELDQEKPGVLLSDGSRADVSEIVRDYDSQFFQDGGLSTLSEWLKKNGKVARRVPPEARYGPPISRPGKIVCVGLNYREHALESKKEIPEEPILFLKATSSFSGPFDQVVIPRNSSKLDWEVELAVVVGKKARNIDPKDAAQYIAGYSLLNDYSEREFQLERGGQWTKGKSADTFCPVGPFVATTDEIAHPNALDIWLKVNGTTRQSANTSDMIFDVPYLIAYISRFMSLLPGDIVSTGTPSGVGSGARPQIFLKPGDIVELGIAGLGASQQQITGPV
jgi:2-keto-4-pentenoate hydratase/2-oxohepta-3-ene-1,7-dioic acid hydratase in catechol pathway